MDAISSVGIESYNCDKKYGTNYYQRFTEWLKVIQKNDAAVFSGVTDVKGDRSKRPSEQSYRTCTRTMGTPTESRKPGLTRSHVAPQ